MADNRKAGKRKLIITKQFKKDYQRCRKRGWQIELLDEVISRMLVTIMSINCVVGIPTIWNVTSSLIGCSCMRYAVSFKFLNEPELIRMFFADTKIGD